MKLKVPLISFEKESLSRRTKLLEECLQFQYRKQHHVKYNELSRLPNKSNIVH